MKKNTSPLLILFTALVFTFLFYKESIGINLLIFETLVLCIILFIQRDNPRSFLAHFAIATTMVTAISFVINYTVFSMITNIVSFFIMTGVLIYPEAKSLITALRLSISNVGLSIHNFFHRIGEPKSGKHGISLRTTVHRAITLIIPLGIVVLFLSFYNLSSPYFNEVYSEVSEKIGRLIDKIDYSWVFVFSLGLLCTVFALIRITSSKLIEKDRHSTLLMARIRKKIRSSKPFYLKRELVAAQFLLITLNVLILVLNILDIKNVWFGFVWNGSFLKQFVHSGTYVLIISILISVAVVLYFFRGNINFYKNSRLLKQLAILWMVQNAVLAISVAIRNYWYIYYFALAYKRIGVLFFLLATVYGIFTVIMKIKNRQSSFYLFRNNSMAILVIMLVISLVNWDTLIARYNFSHYRTAFIHYDFLSALPDKSLPYLDKTREELHEIDVSQQKLFRFPMKYMTSEEYFNEVEKKKSAFKLRWKEKGFLSWNYAEYAAYNRMKLPELAAKSEK